jgi:hypothetical protein
MATPTTPRDEIVNLYKVLNIPDEVPEDVLRSWDPVEPIYQKIYDVIATDPATYRHIVDEIIASNLIMCFDIETRNKISLLYPEDEELAYKLLIDTTTYYKIKYYPVLSYDEEDCDKLWRLMVDMDAIYFTNHFSEVCWSNPIIKKLLDENDITKIYSDTTWVNEKLWKIYMDRRLVGN